MDTTKPKPAGVTDPEVPLVLTGTWAFQVRNLLVRNLELLFVLFVGLSVVAVFYLFPYKIAFLNFFYLPVMAAAYLLGKRKAVLALPCVFCPGFSSPTTGRAGSPWRARG